MGSLCSNTTATTEDVEDEHKREEERRKQVLEQDCRVIQRLFIIQQIKNYNEEAKQYFKDTVDIAKDPEYLRLVREFPECDWYDAKNSKHITKQRQIEKRRGCQ